MKKFLLIAAAAGVLTTGAGATGTANLQGTVFTVDTLAHYYIGPGVTHTHLSFASGSRRFQAYVVDMDRTASSLLRAKVEIGHDSCHTAERMTDMAKRKTTATRQYLAGINGDFFITSGFTANHPLGNAILGYPNMSCVTDGMIAAPDIIDKASRENALIVDRSGYMYIDATDLRYRILASDGKTAVAEAEAINFPRGDGSLTVYNSYAGGYTETSANGKELVLRLADGETWAVNRPVKFIVDKAWRNGGNSAIPKNGLVISMGPSFSGGGHDALSALAPGDEICFEVECSLPAFGAIKPDISEVVGGDVRILKENEVTTTALRWINTPSALYSRSLAGYSKDRNHMVICAVDGSIPTSSGISYYEGADLMRALGCWDALDLDGGGSTAIWTHSHGITNHLRDGSERAVGNGLYIVLDAPADKTVASLRFDMPAIVLPLNGQYTPVIYGYNQYGQLVDTDIDGFTLSAPEALGVISADGHTLTASGSGTHALTVTKGDMTATIPVTIDNTTPAVARVTDILMDNIHPWQVEMQAMILGKPMPVAPMAYRWATDNSHVADIDREGNVSGHADGTATLTGTLDTADDPVTLNVTVECPKAASMPAFAGGFEADGWTVAGTGIKNGSATAASADGIADINFTISSSRATRLQINKDVRLYSRPDALELALDTKGHAIKTLIVGIIPSDIKRVVNITLQPQAGADGLYRATIPLSEVTDITAIDAYPMTLKDISIVPSSPRTGTYTYTLTALNTIYNAYSASVDNISSGDITADTPLHVTLDGNTATIPFTADRLEAYSIDGRLIARGHNTSALTLPHMHGIYVIHAFAAGTWHTAKIRL